MTLMEAVGVVESIHFGAVWELVSMRVSYTPVWGNRLQVEVAMDTVPRDAPVWAERMTIRQTTVFDLAPATPAAVAAEVHKLARALVFHELDEAFFVDGVRVRDPHAGENAVPHA